MENKSNWGPLTPLIGIWEGTQGSDIAPSESRGQEENKFKERTTFEAFGPVNNHEQALYGLKYQTTAWKIGATEAFHEDMGYWLWDAQDNQIMKCFVIPRGIAIIAGGTVMPEAKTFSVVAKEGSSTYGLCHNLFLEKEFKIVGFELTVEILNSSTFKYSQDTQLLLKGKSNIFHHRDGNTLTKL